ncbi:hypothetical protein [Virgibacillus salexigens]|uniref:Uncharacterized protein n=1 Tax=Virgibacillus massiliensis TaxID=1462526 RepID=A0A024QIS2_9BACI|nr:hypothetical protein [Virgibacillus massiliensis]CDQ41856.1 hypothetical protein BN990_04235 [Virgibacillus massiliensis]
MCTEGYAFVNKYGEYLTLHHVLYENIVVCSTPTLESVNLIPTLPEAKRAYNFIVNNLGYWNLITLDDNVPVRIVKVTNRTVIQDTNVVLY